MLFFKKIFKKISLFLKSGNSIVEEDGMTIRNDLLARTFLLKNNK